MFVYNIVLGGYLNDTNSNSTMVVSSPDYTDTCTTTDPTVAPTECSGASDTSTSDTNSTTPYVDNRTPMQIALSTATWEWFLHLLPWAVY